MLNGINPKSTAPYQIISISGDCIQDSQILQVAQESVRKLMLTDYNDDSVVLTTRGVFAALLEIKKFFNNENVQIQPVKRNIKGAYIPNEVKLIVKGQTYIARPSKNEFIFGKDIQYHLPLISCKLKILTKLMLTEKGDYPEPNTFTNLNPRDIELAEIIKCPKFSDGQSVFPEYWFDALTEFKIETSVFQTLTEYSSSKEDEINSPTIYIEYAWFPPDGI